MSNKVTSKLTKVCLLLLLYMLNKNESGNDEYNYCAAL